MEEDGDQDDDYMPQLPVIPLPRTVRTTVFLMPIVNNAQEFTYNPRLGIAVRGTPGRGRGNSLRGRGNSIRSNPSSISTRPNITRSIYILPTTAIWITREEETLPFIKSWPLDSPSVLISLPATTQWEGLVHPFPNHSVEFGITRAFQQSTTSAYSGLFYRRSKKRKGIGSERGFYLEPFRRQKGALFGSLVANTYLVYCHEPTQLP
jgi:hypothetical protein